MHINVVAHVFRQPTQTFLLQPCNLRNCSPILPNFSRTYKFWMSTNFRQYIKQGTTASNEPLTAFGGAAKRNILSEAH